MIAFPSRNKTKLLPFCIQYPQTSAGVRSSLLDAYELTLKSSLFFSEVQSAKVPKTSTAFNASYLKQSRGQELGTKERQYSSCSQAGQMHGRSVTEETFGKHSHQQNSNICKQFRVNAAKPNISRETLLWLYSAHRAEEQNLSAHHVWGSHFYCWETKSLLIILQSTFPFLQLPAQAQTHHSVHTTHQSRT